MSVGPCGHCREPAIRQECRLSGGEVAELCSSCCAALRRGDERVEYSVLVGEQPQARFSSVGIASSRPMLLTDQNMLRGVRFHDHGRASFLYSPRSDRLLSLADMNRDRVEREQKQKRQT
jgi:hypothetical protein